MNAFNGSQATKDQYLDAIKQHQANGEIVQAGFYWDGKQGTLIGCAIHSSNVQDMETVLGIPQDVACLAEAIFDNIAEVDAPFFPRKFLEAIRPGADLRGIGNEYAAQLIDKESYGLLSMARLADYGEGFAASGNATFTELARLFRCGATNTKVWSATHSKCQDLLQVAEALKRVNSEMPPNLAAVTEAAIDAAAAGLHFADDPLEADSPLEATLHATARAMASGLAPRGAAGPSQLETFLAYRMLGQRLVRLIKEV